MTLAADEIVAVLQDGGTYDAVAVGKIRREVSDPTEIVIVVEDRTLADVISDLEAAGYTIRLVKTDAPSDESWRLSFTVDVGDSRSFVTVICALSGEYESFVWYYTGSESEIHNMQEEAISQGFTSLDQHGLYDGMSYVNSESGIYSGLSLPYKGPTER